VILAVWDGLPAHLHSVLLLPANDLVLGATPALGGESVLKLEGGRRKLSGQIKRDRRSDGLRWEK
jgi:hypothetical protein